MSKILLLLILLLIAYQSLKPWLKRWKGKKTSRKEYKLTFSKQFNHLFSATLLLIIPLLCISSYYWFYLLLPFLIQVVLAILVFLCWLAASLSFYLYFHYKNKTPYQGLCYDANHFTLELNHASSKEIIKLNQVRSVQWVSSKNFLKMMPWSNFEYFVLEGRNGTNLVITSLMITSIELQSMVSSLALTPRKKNIPTIP